MAKCEVEAIGKEALDRRRSSEVGHINRIRTATSKRQLQNFNGFEGIECDHSQSEDSKENLRLKKSKQKNKQSQRVSKKENFPLDSEDAVHSLETKDQQKKSEDGLEGSNQDQSSRPEGSQENLHLKKSPNRDLNSDHRLGSERKTRQDSPSKESLHSSDTTDRHKKAEGGLKGSSKDESSGPEGSEETENRQNRSEPEPTDSNAHQNSKSEGSKKNLHLIKARQNNLKSLTRFFSCDCISNEESLPSDSADGAPLCLSSLTEKSKFEQTDRPDTDKISVPEVSENNLPLKKLPEKNSKSPHSISSKRKSPTDFADETLHSPDTENQGKKGKGWVKDSSDGQSSESEVSEDNINFKKSPKKSRKSPYDISNKRKPPSDSKDKAFLSSEEDQSSGSEGYKTNLKTSREKNVKPPHRTSSKRKSSSESVDDTFSSSDRENQRKKAESGLKDNNEDPSSGSEGSVDNLKNSREKDLKSPHRFSSKKQSSLDFEDEIFHSSDTKSRRKEAERRLKDKNGDESSALEDSEDNLHLKKVKQKNQNSSHRSSKIRSSSLDSVTPKNLVANKSRSSLNSAKQRKTPASSKTISSRKPSSKTNNKTNKKYNIKKEPKKSNKRKSVQNSILNKGKSNSKAKVAESHQKNMVSAKQSGTFKYQNNEEKQTFYSDENVSSMKSSPSSRDIIVLKWLHNLQCPEADKLNDKVPEGNKSSSILILKKPLDSKAGSPSSDMLYSKGHEKELSNNKKVKSTRTEETRSSEGMNSDSLEELDYESYPSPSMSDENMDVEMSVSNLGKLQINLKTKFLSPEDAAILIWLDDIPKSLLQSDSKKPQSTTSLKDRLSSGGSPISTKSTSDLEDVPSSKPNIYFPAVTVLRNVSVGSKVGLKALKEDPSNSVYYRRCNLSHIAETF